MKYRLHKVSDTLHRVTLGRDTIGWARKFEQAWTVKTNLGNGRGKSADEAFVDFVRSRNNHEAQQKGFASAKDMVEQRNEKVREQVKQMNEVCGLPLFKVRRGRRILV